MLPTPMLNPSTYVKSRLAPLGRPTYGALNRIGWDGLGSDEIVFEGRGPAHRLLYIHVQWLQISRETSLSRRRNWSRETPSSQTRKLIKKVIRLCVYECKNIKGIEWWRTQTQQMLVSSVRSLDRWMAAATFYLTRFRDSGSTTIFQWMETMCASQHPLLPFASRRRCRGRAVGAWIEWLAGGGFDSAVAFWARVSGGLNGCMRVHSNIFHWTDRPTRAVVVQSAGLTKEIRRVIHIKWSLSRVQWIKSTYTRTYVYRRQIGICRYII